MQCGSHSGHCAEVCVVCKLVLYAPLSLTMQTTLDMIVQAAAYAFAAL